MSRTMIPSFLIWFYPDSCIPDGCVMNLQIVNEGRWDLLSIHHSQRFAPYYGA